MKNKRTKLCLACDKLILEPYNRSNIEWQDRKYCSVKCAAKLRNPKILKPLLDTFWEKVKITDNCWEWIGTKDACGYGVFKNNNKRYFAHRFSYQIHKGDLIKGLVIMHSCDNPACVNPDHLSQNSQRENVLDMYNKKRYSRSGIKNPRCKVDEKIIIEIKNLYKKGLKQIEIAKIFNLCQSHISTLLMLESTESYRISIQGEKK